MTDWLSEPLDRIAWVLAEFIGGPLDGELRGIPYGVLGLGIVPTPRTDSDASISFTTRQNDLAVGAYRPEGMQYTMDLTVPSQDAKWDPTLELTEAGLSHTVFRWARAVDRS